MMKYEYTDFTSKNIKFKLEELKEREYRAIPKKYKGNCMWVSHNCGVTILEYKNDILVKITHEWVPENIIRFKVERFY